MKSEKVRVRGKRVGYVISGLRSLNDASTASSSSVVYCGVCVWGGVWEGGWEGGWGYGKR